MAKPDKPAASSSWFFWLLLVIAIGLLALTVWSAVQPDPRGEPPVIYVPKVPPAAPAPASPRFQFRPTSSTRTLQVIEYTHFTVGYDNQRKAPAWVVYELDGPDAYHGAAPDRPNFATETRTSAGVTHRDYTNSGYDRGHLFPAHAAYTRFGPEGFRETFVMTNIVPQPHPINAGIWEDLEDNISGDTNDDGWAASLRNLTVINGPVYDDKPEYLPSGVEISDECFSVILDYQEQGGGYKVLPFEMPNKGKPSGPISQWLTSIREIEQDTGLNLFAGMDATQRALIEDTKASDMWPESHR